MSVMSVSMKGRAGFMHFDRRHSWKDQKNNNKSPAGYHNPPPRAHHRNLPGCIFPRTLTYCFTVMVYLFSTVCYTCILQITVHTSRMVISFRDGYFPHISILQTISTGNGLAIWHSFPDITYDIKVNNGLKLAIFNLIELKFFRAHPYLKSHI